MNIAKFKSELFQLSKGRNLELSRIQYFLENHFTGHPIPHVTLEPRYFTRASLNRNGEVFRHWQRCSYNPKLEEINLQRCNYPKQQVFYCSMDSETTSADPDITCIVETCWEYIKDYKQRRFYVTMSKWMAMRKLKVLVLPFLDISSEKNSTFQKIKEQANKEILQNFDNSNEIFAKLKHISNIFSGSHNKKRLYKISAAFFNFLFKYDHQNIYDGLMFPSANTEGSGINLALKKHLIDHEILMFDSAAMFSIQRNPIKRKSLCIQGASHIAKSRRDGKLDFGPIF